MIDLARPLSPPTEYWLVVRVRAHYMRFPEAAEAIAHGRFGYRAGSRRFAIVGTAHRDGERWRSFPTSVSANPARA